MKARRRSESSWKKLLIQKSDVLIIYVIWKTQGRKVVINCREKGKKSNTADL